MKTQESKDHQLLLDAVLSPASGHAGPTCTEVLGLLRKENQRRRRVRGFMAAGGTCMLAAMLWSQNDAPLPPMASRSGWDEAPPLVLRQVGDAQLFALLKDTPAALVKLPDGTERLLILQP